ncbi:hypothetical protein, partial [Bacillus sp. T33-2]|uniref:hypothetical protein n=1 Tax=Bacillus sp. T33-2 TaxID=2054168 RepID=UPI000CC5645B
MTQSGQQFGQQLAGGFTGTQSGMQPGFSGTDGFTYGSQQQGGFGQQFGMQAGFTQPVGGMQDGNQMRRGMMGSPQMAQNAQAALQPNFGTNPQQVRQDIARDLAYGSQQQQGGFAQQGGLQGTMMGGSFDGTTMMAGGMAGGMADGSQMRRGMMGSPQMAQNPQSVLSPNFGTNPQQVRQDIARDLAYGQQQQQGGFTQQAGMQGTMMGGSFDGTTMMAGG